MVGPRDTLRGLAYDYDRIISNTRDIERVSLESGDISIIPKRIGLKFFIEKWSSPAIRGIGAVFQYIIVFPEIVIDGSELSIGPYTSNGLKIYLLNRGVS